MIVPSFRTFVACTALVSWFQYSCAAIPTYSMSSDGGTFVEGGAPVDGSTDSNVERPSCSPCLMFTSPLMGSGALFGAGGSGGIARVDALCTGFGHKVPGKEGSTWKAFLWYSGSSPFTRLKSPKDGFYSVPDKTTGTSKLLFANVEGMKSPTAPPELQLLPDGTTFDSEFIVWTGGGSEAREYNCDDWSSAGAARGWYGDPRGSWSSQGSEACSVDGRVYCVEQ